MPLVRIMATDSLSWVERERVSEAIAACVRQWEKMEEERRLLNQQAATGYGLQGYQANPQGSHIG
jgi:hypothetical protein